LKALRNHGSEVKYYHKYVGWNARLDTIHAAILRAKLPHVEGWLAGRRAAAARYDSLIADAGLLGFFRRPLAKPDRLHTYNQYTLRVAADRDALVKHLKDNGIGCEIYYPLPLHLQECVANRGYRTGDFPVSEEASKSVVSLPMYAEITIEQQRRVIEVCAAFVAGRVRKAA
jgi:dTDP-4-amino-4,6-dideoxygalactose transaminase